MTATTFAGAPFGKQGRWTGIDQDHCLQQVRRLQARIVKAVGGRPLEQGHCLAMAADTLVCGQSTRRQTGHGKQGQAHARRGSRCMVYGGC